MIYRFRILSNEAEDFIREVEIRANQTFLDFHNAIQDAVGYDKSQMASFFITDEKWGKGQEITLFDMGNMDESERFEMDKTILSDQLKEKGQRLLYVFDFFSERGFFIELVMTMNRNPEEDFPLVVWAKGTAPEQIVLGDMSVDLPNNDDLDDELGDTFGSEISLDDFDDFSEDNSLY